MASIKNLKKDINFLVDEVIGVCLLHQHTRSDKPLSELDEMILEMDNYREELIKRVNNPDEAGSKNLRAYYRSLFDELLEKVNGAFDKLNSVTQ